MSHEHPGEYTERHWIPNVVRLEQLRSQLGRFNGRRPCSNDDVLCNDDILYSRPDTFLQLSGDEVVVWRLGFPALIGRAALPHDSRRDPAATTVALRRAHPQGPERLRQGAEPAAARAAVDDVEPNVVFAALS